MVLWFAGTYSVGTGVVWACDCTLDSQRVIAASAEQKLMVFDVCSGELLCTVQEQGPCKCVFLCLRRSVVSGRGRERPWLVSRSAMGSRPAAALRVSRFVEWNRKPTEQNKFVVCHEHFGSHPKAIKVYRASFFFARDSSLEATRNAFVWRVTWPCRQLYVRAA